MANRNHHYSASPRDRPRSPHRRDRPRSRSPWRPGKDAGGEKRKHDVDHYGTGSSDPRRSKHHIGQERSFRGYDASTARSSHVASHRDRDRSRSPFRHEPTDRQPHPSSGPYRPSTSQSTESVTDSALSLGERIDEKKPAGQRELALNDVSKEMSAKMPELLIAHPDDGSGAQER